MSASDLSILVVEDETFMLSLVVRILAGLGYPSITTASNGRQALEHAPSTFDVIISDLNMPEMDGVELLGHLATRQFSGGIVLLSGEDERILETAMGLARTQRLNVLGTLPKPLKPEPLKALLASYEETDQQQMPASEPQLAISEDELRAGADGERLALVYQPKIRVSDGSVVGVETLARWNHDSRGLLGPAAFIPLAEDTGVIHPLTLSIYRKAITQLCEWTSQGLDLKMSINVSINSFASENFASSLIALSQAMDVDFRQIIFEVTESQVVDDIFHCLATLMQLRMKRIGLSIDDFGTGNATLQQLKRIPFTELKIDRGFVTGACRDASTRAILESSIELARKLKMETVAEGVETRGDWDLVEALGVDQVQGYYCAKPLSADQFQEFYANYSGPHSQT